MFRLNVNITTADVKNNLRELSKSDYTTIGIFKTAQIRDVILDSIGVFTKGSAYYQLTKPETIQEYKKICIRDRNTNKVYSGSNARSILGFPNGAIRVKPENLGKFNIFIQSTFVNRKVVPGTSILVLK